MLIPCEHTVLRTAHIGFPRQPLAFSPARTGLRSHRSRRRRTSRAARRLSAGIHRRGGSTLSSLTSKHGLAQNRHRLQQVRPIANIAQQICCLLPPHMQPRRPWAVAETAATAWSAAIRTAEDTRLATCHVKAEAKPGLAQTLFADQAEARGAGRGARRSASRVILQYRGRRLARCSRATIARTCG
jgi:hypothetical protein